MDSDRFVVPWVAVVVGIAGLYFPWNGRSCFSTEWPVFVFHGIPTKNVVRAFLLLLSLGIIVKSVAGILSLIVRTTG